MEQKGREIHEAAGASQRASQGFPGRVCVCGCRRAVAPLQNVSVCEQPRETGGCGVPDQDGGGSRGWIPARCGRLPIVRAQAAPWAPGALSPAERTAPAPRGRAWCFPRGAGPAVHPRRHPWEPRLPGSRGRRRHGEAAAAAALPAGARSAGGGARGWVAAGECARLARELRGGGPATGAPRLASRTEPASLLHRHTPTQLHRVPPSTRRPRWPPPRLGQRDPATSPGLVPLSENLLIFFSLHSSPLWSGRWRRQGDGGSTQGKGVPIEEDYCSF